MSDESEEEFEGSEVDDEEEEEKSEEEKPEEENEHVSEEEKKEDEDDFDESAIAPAPHDSQMEFEEPAIAFKVEDSGLSPLAIIQ